MEPEVKDIIFDTNLKQVQQDMKDTTKVTNLMGKAFKEVSTAKFSPDETKVLEKYKDTLTDMMKVATSTGTNLSKVTDGFKITAFADGTAEIKNFSENAKEAGNNVKDIGGKSQISLSKGLKILTKFTLGLIGIRSVWSILTKASSQYMQENQQVNAQLKVTSSILANMIGPAIEGLVNIAEYALIVISKLIEAMTGYDAVGKALTATQKNLGKQAQKTNKALASFDTITNLSQDTGATDSYKSMLDAYNNFVDKKNEVDTIFKKWGKDIDDFLIILASLWGTKTIVGLSKLIGTVGTAGTIGTGLAGVSGLLAGLAGMAAIEVTIWCILKGYQKFKGFKAFVEKWSPEYIDERTEALEKTSDVVEYIAENTQDIEENTVGIGENYSFWNEIVGTLSGEHKNVLKISKDIVENTGKVVGKTNDIIENQKLSEGEAQKLLDYLVKQYQTNMGIETELMLQDKDTSGIKESQKELLDTVIKVRDKYKVSNEYIWSMYDGTKEINGIKIADKDFKINIDADPSSAERKTDTWFGKITKFFNNLQLNSFANFFGKFKMFDVGTNYVPQDMPAVVHKGEMIVPKKYNPMTSGIGGTNEETNALLRQLNNTLEQKQFNGYISASEITNTAIEGINQQSRIMGRSVIK